MTKFINIPYRYIFHWLALCQKLLGKARSCFNHTFLFAFPDIFFQTKFCLVFLQEIKHSELKFEHCSGTTPVKFHLSFSLCLVLSHNTVNQKCTGQTDYNLINDYKEVSTLHHEFRWNGAQQNGRWMLSLKKKEITLFRCSCLVKHCNVLNIIYQRAAREGKFQFIC